MAIQFDASKVAMFRNVQLADDDSMANLGGKTAQIVVPVKDEVRGEYKFVPAVDRNNKPVVRPLTEADIDEIGRACLYNTVG